MSEYMPRPEFLNKLSTATLLHYSKMGTKLRNTVRTKENITSESSDFEQIKKQGLTTQTVAFDLVPREHADWVDSLEKLEDAGPGSDFDIVTRSMAYGLGRESDAQIVDELNKSTNYSDESLDCGMTAQKVLSAYEMLTYADALEGSERFAIVGWKQWGELLTIDEFADVPYIPDTELAWKGTQAKSWLGATWMPHSGLHRDENGVRYCHWYYKTAIGHAIGDTVHTAATWHEDRGALFVTNTLKQRGCLIDTTSVVTMRCMEF